VLSAPQTKYLLENLYLHHVHTHPYLRLAAWKANIILPWAKDREIQRKRGCPSSWFSSQFPTPRENYPWSSVVSTVKAMSDSLSQSVLPFGESANDAALPELIRLAARVPSSAHRKMHLNSVVPAKRHINRDFIQTNRSSNRT
ncbi:unnamed protein product, partial [Ectocarpus sp. 4 AP-2014]